MSRVSPADLEQFTAFANRLADASGEVIMPHFRTEDRETEKDKIQHGRKVFDPVTEADRGAEKAIRTLIEAEYPEHGILGEEFGRKEGNGLYWVLDPIDGTRSFITGMPTWGTLIALNDGISPIVGILDQPFTKERFVGAGGRAWLGDRTLKTRACGDLSEAMLLSTTPDMFDPNDELPRFFDLENKVRMRRFGGDCYSYGALALGQVDLIVESDMQAYDIQALIPIVEGAGGLVTTWEGGDAQHGGQILAAGDPRAHEAAMKVLSG